MGIRSVLSRWSGQIPKTHLGCGLGRFYQGRSCSKQASPSRWAGGITHFFKASSPPSLSDGSARTPLGYPSPPLPPFNAVEQGAQKGVGQQGHKAGGQGLRAIITCMADDGRKLVTATSRLMGARTCHQRRASWAALRAVRFIQAGAGAAGVCRCPHTCTNTSAQPHPQDRRTTSKAVTGQILEETNRNGFESSG